MVTKEVAKAKKPVVAAKYHSFAQTCDKRIKYQENHGSLNPLLKGSFKPIHGRHLLSITIFHQNLIAKPQRIKQSPTKDEQPNDEGAHPRPGQL